jgi:transposase, IS5 family
MPDELSKKDEEKLRKLLDKISDTMPALLNKIIDFDIFEPLLYEFLETYNIRSLYDPILLFRLVLLQKYYNLSEYEVLELSKDRVSFIMFLSTDSPDDSPDDLPDEICLMEFSEKLVESGYYEPLFNIFEGILTDFGVSINSESDKIVDLEYIEEPSTLMNNEPE